MAKRRIQASAARTYDACLIVGRKNRLTLELSDPVSFTLVFRDFNNKKTSYSFSISATKADECLLTIANTGEPNMFAMMLTSTMPKEVERAVKKIPEKTVTPSQVIVTNPGFGEMLADTQANKPISANSSTSVPSNVSSPTPVPNSSSSNIGTELEKLSSLLDSGILTQTEFDKAKARLLG